MLYLVASPWQPYRITLVALDMGTVDFSGFPALCAGRPQARVVSRNSAFSRIALFRP